MTAITRLQLWPLRVLWVGLALVAGGPVSDALAGRSTPVAAVIVVASWTGWGAMLVALLVPRTSSLTVVRVLAPAAWVGAIAAAAAASNDGSLLTVAMLSLASGCVVLAFAPWVTDAFVDGSSYGPERRLALRTPLTIALVAVVTWAAVVVGASAGPLLLAAEQWLIGAISLGAGTGVVVLGSRSLHQLSQRWVVFVPTGMVLHDPMTLPEPQLFLRQTMRRMGPAEADAPADLLTEDLTAGASGLVVELVLDEPVDLLVRQGRAAATRAVDRVLFTPALPAALLDEARRNRLPVA